MNDSARDAQYSNTAKVLHWLIAGLIVLQFILARLAENADHAGLAVRELALLANHKSVGITILALALVRLGWRLRAPPPALPVSMSQWQKLASQVSHWTLYGLIILIPVSGWLMSSASAYSVSWFNLLQLPDFVAPDPDLKAVFLGIHELLGKLLFVVALLHILAALKHHVVDKDKVLARMSSTLTVGLFVAVIVIGGWALGTAGTAPAVSERAVAVVAPAPEPVVAEPVVAAPAVAAELPLWQIDHADSFIRFTGNQAGADFNGEWQDWSAELRFDSNDLANSSFEVTVQTSAVSTGDADRDVTLADAEWFDVAKFPAAFYHANRFTQLDDERFAADGMLTIKGVATPVALLFSVTGNDPDRVLLGTADLLRLDLGVGTGEWEDTTWVGNEVRVDVRVHATLSQ